jgi:hypothetical protein
MPITMFEPVVDAINTSLQAHLPQKIAALEPTFVPLLKMPAPVEYVFGEKATFLKGYPVVQLVQLDTAMPDDDLRWADHRHRLEVGVFIQAPIEENLARLLDRYARCLLECLMERRRAGDFTDSAAAFDLHFNGETIAYSSTLPQAGQFVRALFLPMRAERRNVERS